MALSLRQRPMILVQLVHEPAVRRRGRAARAHELERLRGMQAVCGNEVSTDDGDGAGRAHRAVHEHARLGARTERARDVPRRAGEVRRELRERRVVQRDLRRVRRERSRERDAPGHGGEHVRDAERGERRGVLCGLEVRDVQAREDLGDVWGGCGRDCGGGRRVGGRGRGGLWWEWVRMGLRVQGMGVCV